MNKSEFYQKLKKIKGTIPSITGRASYSKFELRENLLWFIRNKTGKDWNLNVEDLYKAYKKLDEINTVIIRPFFRAERVYSPACAILIAMSLYDKNGIKNKR